MMQKIALIPARGGSKRIPRKNIRTFCGQPMISWSIKSAINSGCFDKVFVSTDDKEIAKISKDYGAEVPFIRPASLANDYASTVEVVRHSIIWFQNNNIQFDVLSCIYATAPFIQKNDLIKASELIDKVKTNSFVFSATSFPFPIQRAFKISKFGSSKMFNPELFNTRSQDLEEAYHDAGMFYFANSNTWLNKTNIFEDSFPLLLPRWRVQDIDTEEDWERAEILHKLIKLNDSKK